MGEKKFGFQAEVGKILDIVAHSLYSDRDVFLRELISNASDACDRLRYAALTQPELMGPDPLGTNGAPCITLKADPKARTLTIADNGIGMNREDLVENLGTIARSGTAAFLEKLSGDGAKDMALIGQFGVGFYSAFMVADRVEVVTRKAGEDQAWRWWSEGKGDFTVAPGEAAARGTTVRLHLREGAEEFLEPARLREIVAMYSDHIAIPILLEAAPGNGAGPKAEEAGKGDGAETKAETSKEANDGAPEVLNQACALWARPKAEITQTQYKEFYHHVAHAFDDPWMVLHTKAEGVIEYTSLLFVPSTRPMNLFEPDRKHCVKLYVRRVFITDDCVGLLPPYLRFLRGIVDSQDLPLNISRETLQHNPVLAKIRAALTGRVLGELAKKAQTEADAYARFWDAFGAVLKEGIYEDQERRDAILELCRFRTTTDAGLVSLTEYKSRMKEGQNAIFYITGDDRPTLAQSPQIEGFAARGVEVLLLTDPVDEFWVPAVGAYQGTPFKSVTKGGADLGKMGLAPNSDKATRGKEARKGDGKGGKKAAAKGAAEAKDAAEADLGPLIAALKEVLKDSVKDVRASERLTESPVCLVADDGDLDMHLERLLAQHQRLGGPSARILEINPGHRLIRKLAALAASGNDAGGGKGDGPGGDKRKALAEAGRLLLDQARIVEGEPLPDPAGFSRRLVRALEKGLSG